MFKSQIFRIWKMETIVGETAVNFVNNVGQRAPEMPKIVILDSRDTEALEHQVAGHSKIGVGVLRHKSGFVMKPKQDDTRWNRELEFYRKIYEAKNGISAFRHQLQSLTPSFFGVSSVVAPDCGKPKQYLMLEDVVGEFKKPCVLDIKIGAVTWNPEAPLSKIEAEMKKYVGTKSSLGISIAGMYYFDIQMQEFIRKERHFGRALNHDLLYESMKHFVNYKKSRRSKFIIKQILEKLHSIKNYFEEQSEFAFYSSSILIAYDAVSLEKTFITAATAADIGDGRDNGRTDSTSSSVRAFMIDFAHVFPLDASASRDDNYLFGLTNVVKLFQSIHDDKTHFITTKEIIY